MKVHRMSECPPGCTKPCCAAPCEGKKPMWHSKCPPGCTKPCCSRAHIEMKVHRTSKCPPGCTKPCCAAPCEGKKPMWHSKCPPGCTKPCCAGAHEVHKDIWIEKPGTCAESARSHEMKMLRHLVEGEDGKHVYIMKAGPGEEPVWIEASDDWHLMDRDHKVKKIHVKKSGNPEVKEIIINDDGIWYADDPEDMEMLGSGREKIAWLGVHLQDLTPDLREAFDLPSGLDGALITDVDQSGPARKWGLRKGFVVVEFDDTPIHSADDLVRAVRASEPGKRVTVVMNRKGSEIIRRVVLGSRTPEVGMVRDLRMEKPDVRIMMPEIDKFVDVERLAGGGAFLGVSAETLTEEERHELGLPEDMGVMITEVHEGTAAEKYGLEKGDVIARIDDEDIEEVDDLVDAISSRDPGDEVTLFLLRDGEKTKMNVELGERETIKSIRLRAPEKYMMKPGERIEMRREVLKKHLMKLHRRIEEMEEELEELEEKLEGIEEN